ncbi:MAG: hypothetical protein WB785_11660 [Mycobacterium sp.]|uniref:hypothetical protein n=1 Tax=Mycobacterium sp. TaxID=1785 RepID=UPI003C3CADD0
MDNAAAYYPEINAMVALDHVAAGCRSSQSGLTLVAFLRGESMNVYTRPDRLVQQSDS